MKSQTAVWLVLVAVIAVSTAAFFGFRMSVTDAQQIEPQPDPNTGKTVSGEQEFCANNPSLDLGIRALDVLATSTSYENATVYLKNLETGTVVERSMDDSTGNFDSHSNVLKCGNPKGYEILVKTTQDGFNAIEEKVTVTPEELFQDPVEKSLKISKHSLIKAKAYDSDLRQKMSDSGSTDYATMPASFNETGDDAITVGADGYLDVEFTLAPVSANEAAGKTAILCINYADDSNVDDWESTSLDVTFEGKSLSEATLSANDAVALSAYEMCYALPHPVGKTASGVYDSVSTATLYMESQSGVNPDFDPVLRYVEMGDYLSSEDPNQILMGVAAQDNSARTFLGSATASTITIDIV